VQRSVLAHLHLEHAVFGPSFFSQGCIMGTCLSCGAELIGFVANLMLSHRHITKKL